jgi:hypothetical protein
MVWVKSVNVTVLSAFGGPPPTYWGILGPKRSSPFVFSVLQTHTVGQNSEIILRVLLLAVAPVTSASGSHVCIGGNTLQTTTNHKTEARAWIIIRIPSLLSSSLISDVSVPDIAPVPSEYPHRCFVSRPGGQSLHFPVALSPSPPFLDLLQTGP